MKRSFKDYLGITARGLAMGAADVVPGVSGGTIALITGIYEELIDSFSKINMTLLKVLRKEGLVAAFKYVNGPFLVALITGIAISILSLAKVFNYLITNKPVLVWSFFFGLIIASIFLVGKLVKNWNAANIAAIIIGTLISFGVTIISPANGPDTYLYLFLSGMLAFVAMILPGISGSFILLLLGAYHLVLGKVSELLDALSAKDMDLLISHTISLGVFAIGGIIGLLSFSKILKWMFEKYESTTLALLTGFLIGSLNKVWPWKQTTQVYVKHAGEENEKVVPLIQQNVWPNDAFREVSEADAQLGITEKDPQLLVAVGLAIAGFLVIYLLERFASKNQEA